MVTWLSISANGSGPPRSTCNAQWARARPFVLSFLARSVVLRLGSSALLFAAFRLLQSSPLCSVIALCLRGPRAFLAFYFFTLAPSKTYGPREAVDDGALRLPRAFRSPVRCPRMSLTPFECERLRVGLRVSFLNRSYFCSDRLSHSPRKGFLRTRFPSGGSLKMASAASSFALLDFETDDIGSRP